MQFFLNQFQVIKFYKNKIKYVIDRKKIKETYVDKSLEDLK